MKLPLTRANRSDRLLTVRETERVQSADTVEKVADRRSR
jgi:hypothetical protein